MSYFTPLWNAWKAAAATETRTEAAAPAGEVRADGTQPPDVTGEAS